MDTSLATMVGRTAGRIMHREPDCPLLGAMSRSLEAHDILLSDDQMKHAYTVAVGFAAQLLRESRK